MGDGRAMTMMGDGLGDDEEGRANNGNSWQLAASLAGLVNAGAAKAAVAGCWLALGQGWMMLISQAKRADERKGWADVNAKVSTTMMKAEGVRRSGEGDGARQARRWGVQKN